MTRTEATLRKDTDRAIRIFFTLAFVALVVSFPDAVFAGDTTSPFMTGAEALRANLFAWLTPVAIILVMALGAMAMANRISWGWCFAALLGIAIAFGAPQIVDWVRRMFAVTA